MSSAAASADAEDRRVCEAFATGAVHPRDFRHRDHLRLAYVCLSDESYDAALFTFRRLLREFLQRHRTDPNKYHETLTCAWLQTVALHMARTPGTFSFADFVARHPALLDSNLIFTHYSRDRLISVDARERFIAPDLQPILNHSCRS